MAGPYPRYPDGSAGPQPSQSRYNEPYPSQPFAAQQQSAEEYPRRRRWRLLAVSLLVVAVLAGTGVAIVYAVRADTARSDVAAGFTPPAAEAAIQNFLDALSEGDTDTIARNTLCGMYDAVKDLRSDKALARLASKAFRDQFSRVEVTSIDKIVLLSSNQAQVLFTMRVNPANRASQKAEEQATAALLYQDNRLLVCQYLLRSGGQF